MTPEELVDEKRRAAREYHPCDVGLHVCGQIEDAEGQRPLTVANYPMPSATAARAAFEWARAELAEHHDGDLLVDLNLGRYDQQVEDFWMRRQMLPRLAALAASPLRAPSPANPERRMG